MITCNSVKIDKLKTQDPKLEAFNHITTFGLRIETESDLFQCTAIGEQAHLPE